MCAIHQPNLFPRLSTLAKLYAADRWIVLDDVQFARRDYQHRARLADLDEPARQQWLTLPTHLSQGRSTLISQARLVDPQRSRRTVQLLVRQYYGRSPHWRAVSDVLDAVVDALDTSDRVADVAEVSTNALLTVLGWSGDVLDSTEIPTRPGRSERLADLAAATGSTHYLCGTGGLRYLDADPFDAHGIPVLPFHTPVDDPLWQWARRTSSLWALSAMGPGELANRLAVQRKAHFLRVHA
ncbi:MULTISPECIES: WbqC family protein [Streptomyces]|uniref:WbqC family protein n=1 Tax=Streptomyces TaxID=1883 RepID=UPI000559E5BD|nr:MULTISPECIES: WbqC family protein [Streptomyces]MDX2837131.1 WbqC family protein [Streptomyces scabiei]MDX3681768.1 WbqC family protein [Streptomyces scabiei]